MLEEVLTIFNEKPTVENGLKIINKCKEQNTPTLGILFGETLNTVFPNNPIILYDLGVLYMLGGNKEKAYDVFDSLLSLSISENIMKLALANQNTCIESISDKYIYYNKDIIEKIKTKPISKFPLITFTITTCKRFDLFEKTMNSFLNCCTDIEKIDKWLCVDDNSSEEDREKMKEKYPFFEFYFKTFQEKGHPQSMNIIKNKITTPYIFHIEDDWKFFAKKPYMQQCLEIINSADNIGQCLINRNYAEIPKDIGIVGGIFRTTCGGLHYIIHEHCATDKQQQEFDKKYNKGMNCAYWPHFSFRPSLIKSYILKQLGEFNETVSHFEREYSYRFRDAGFVSVFLPNIYCLHIGRLTSERDDTSKLNAYSLNNEKQFSNKEYNIKTYVLNLTRRQDRWDAFIKKTEPKFLNYERYSAIDGSKLLPTEELQRIFDGNNYNMRSGMVGCALSHIQMYIELIESKYEAFCILEDDLDFVPDFKAKFNYLYKNLPKNWDLCYLGHHLWKQYRTQDCFDKTVYPILEKWDTKTSLKFSMGGTGGYLISKQGALNLLEFINKNGMTNGIDTVQQKSADILNIYYCKPHLIYSECCTIENKTDSDIQYNFSSLTIPLEKRVLNEKKFYSAKGDISETRQLEDVCEYINWPNTNALFYYGDFFELDCKYPFYWLDNKVLIIVPNPDSEILNKINRLKKNNKFDIGNVLIFSKPKTISLSSISHVYEAIKIISPSTEAYPFDLINEGSLNTLIKLMDKALISDSTQIVDEIFNSENNQTVSNYNEKMILKNNDYSITFPHENIEKLPSLYKVKFENLRKAVFSKENIIFILCSRYEFYNISDFEWFFDKLIQYNSNIRFLCINTFNTISEKYKKYIDLQYLEFPKKFQVEGWPYEKTYFDQTVFRLKIKEIIEKKIIQ